MTPTSIGPNPLAKSDPGTKLAKGFGPMRQIREPDDHAAEEPAGDLHGDVARNPSPRKHADRRQRDGDGGIEVSAADAVDAVHRDGNGECPAGRDHDPAGVVALGLAENDVGDDTVTEDDQESGAKEFGEER